MASNGNQTRGATGATRAPVSRVHLRDLKPAVIPGLLAGIAAAAVNVASLPAQPENSLLVLEEKAAAGLILCLGIAAAVQLAMERAIRGGFTEALSTWAIIPFIAAADFVTRGDGFEQRRLKLIVLCLVTLAATCWQAWQFRARRRDREPS